MRAIDSNVKRKKKTMDALRSIKRGLGFGKETKQQKRIKKVKKGARKSVKQRRKEEEARKNPEAAKKKSEEQKKALMDQLLKSNGKKNELLKF